MDKELRIILTKYFVIVALTIIYIAFMLSFVGPAINHAAFGQNVTPPITPTPVPTPTPTQPNPNFQYLPQKAAVQVYTPEIGVPQSAQPLQVVPQVVPQPAVQNTNSVGGFDMATILGIISTLAGAGALVKSKLVGDKTNKVEETTREQSEQIVKGAEVDQSIADTMFRLAPEEKVKAMEGTAPEIRLVKLAENKEEAVKTASKA